MINSAEYSIYMRHLWTCKFNWTGSVLEKTLRRIRKIVFLKEVYTTMSFHEMFSNLWRLVFKSYDEEGVGLCRPHNRHHTNNMKIVRSEAWFLIILLTITGCMVVSNGLLRSRIYLAWCLNFQLETDYHGAEGTNHSTFRGQKPHNKTSLFITHFTGKGPSLKLCMVFFWVNSW